ncbi:methyl-accepting chemotaxis protein [Brunnivagina elsteri]|uniref:Methyl-accepting chemotaxis protein n=1 Tax=Brunnivagina elsteri CCALA 953 TaxID=987040 RepID=A0A2A2TI81_9CYAN|nr:methyl-accepting chemotaxis protein [Calothrix elsteri]PAX53440.1 methyl-accepting chemotaxis protein [Calothrix elsteri CCALA 953]
MAATIDDYAQIYQQALTAYAQQKYEEAATLIDQVVVFLPQDPNTHLLRAHVYYVLQNYDIASYEYQKVLELSNDSEIVGFAKNGLESISQYQVQFDDIDTPEIADNEQINFSDLVEPGEFDSQTGGNESLFGDLNNSGFDLSAFGESHQDGHQGDNIFEDYSSSNPFNMPTDGTGFGVSSDDSSGTSNGNPFVAAKEKSQPSEGTSNGEKQSELELPAFWQDEIPTNSFTDAASHVSGKIDNKSALENTSPKTTNNPQQGELDLPLSGSFENTSSLLGEINEIDTTGYLNFNIHSDTDDETIHISGVKDTTDKTAGTEIPKTDTLAFTSQSTSPDDFDNENISQSTTETHARPAEFSTFSMDLTQEGKPHSSGMTVERDSFDADDSFDFEAFESAFGSDSLTDKEPSVTAGNTSSTTSNKAAKGKGNKVEFLDDFDEFDDFGNIPGFDLTGESTFGSSQQLHSGSFENSVKPSSEKYAATSKSKENGSQFADGLGGSVNFGNTSSKSNMAKSTLGGEREDELFSITSSQEAVPIFTQSDVSHVEPQVSVEQGLLAPLENATLETKQWFIAATVGVISALAVASVSFVSANFFSKAEERAPIRNTGLAMALAAGVAGCATTRLMGNLTFKQIRRTTKDLQNQFDAVRQGNMGVQATVYSEDEFGQLAAGFNEMTRVIYTTTSEATRKAHEQEEAKENLQRQVIRLLDDVEGAARGDLTVQAEVTADVLGAVADAFNLTIQNLRDIVQQVKVAAREVTKGATNSETFARALSTDALRQAEELAVTLNSVQVMTDSIQRVAEAAREAETVARDASEIAIKGGEAVENTVAGILEIRETVAETTRKVKRLAESSQEISKIVALISQIASRTNLLALNASIEAARAGEAGRGFAIVADEVRQLADKSAKSLKEIEQIVMQIQGETSSVMTAMEEGTQQVIAGTKLAEEAKLSLDNIIQVANRIDILVRSITADTVDQTETSRAVAQVMQSVELTAQETSQEAQRVSGALQHLVGVSRDLIASVERFRVETAESR